jgi:hypothetical protein
VYFLLFGQDAQGQLTKNMPPPFWLRITSKVRWCSESFFDLHAAKKLSISYLLWRRNMKKTLIFASLSILLILSLTGCTISMVTGSGKLTTDNRSVSGITSLLFAGIGDVTITQGASESLKIEAEDNIMPKIVTTVKGGQLYIGFERENWQDMVNPTKGIKFTLTVKNLNSIELSGLGSVTIPAFKADKLEIKIGGAGGIKISKLESAAVTASMNGAGNLELLGKVTNLDVTLSGLGNFSCGDLQVLNAKVNVSGAGGATIWARDTLNVTIAGAGTVGYYGSPKLSKNITGLGVLNELGVK